MMFLGPIVGLARELTGGDPIIGKYIFGMPFAFLLAFYVSKFALWNTFGREIIEINTDSIYYTADYKFFVRRKVYKRASNLLYSFDQIGYEEDEMGVLTILLEPDSITSAVKMPIEDLKRLIEKITTAHTG
jgi:hypothetical protein